MWVHLCLKRPSRKIRSYNTMELGGLVELLILLGLITCCCGATLYVKPINSTGRCPTSNASQCQTFASYVQSGYKYFHSNTTFIFLPGVHPLNKTAQICNVLNISLVSGEPIFEQQSPAILCQSSPGAAESGLHFCNATGVQIRNLKVSSCGHNVTCRNSTTQAALSLCNVTDMIVSNVVVGYSLGQGLFGWNVFGRSLITQSVFTNNSGTASSFGGNIAFTYKYCCHKDTIQSSVLTINSSFLLYGKSSHKNPLASGLMIFLWCTNIYVNIDNVTAIRNDALGVSVGGNMGIVFRNRTHLIENMVVINNCYIVEGYAAIGGGIFVSFEEVPSNTNNAKCDYTQQLRIKDTAFIGNHATLEGGGLYIIVHEMTGLLCQVGFITVENCTFQSNTLNHTMNAGVALHIDDHYMPGYWEHVTPQYKINITNCSFYNSSVSPPASYDNMSKSSAVFVLQTQAGVRFSDCIFQYNNISALTAVRSNIVFSGEIKFESNYGFDGGALTLCDRSFMYLTPHTNISLINNHAMNCGGGIHVDKECLQSVPECFYQLDRSILKDPNSLNTTHVYLANNTANTAGSALYGASVDFCLIMMPWEYTSATLYGSKVFDDVFRVYHDPNDYSYITSDPYEVCFCNELFQPNCNVTQVEILLYPGGTFNVTIVAVGYRNGTAPGTILAHTKSPTCLRKLQNSQEVGVTCKTLTYTVYSSVKSADLDLKVQQPLLSAPPRFKIKTTTIKLLFRECPLGFMLSMTRCICDSVLQSVHGVECLVTDTTPVIQRSSYSWIGAQEAEIIYQQYCPLDYCKPGLVIITTTNTSFHQDAQCANNRTGLLCGQCQEGLSVVFGSSKCLKCSNKYLALILVLAMAGIALVAFLNVFNLTVSDGTINGLIFYANIMQANSFIFEKVNSNLQSDMFFKVFIAWLNMDLGIEVCFYNGMNALTKSFLQFVFPTYILFLAALIVLLSRRHHMAARLLGTNAVQVLATLFLLCYAKILRIIITAFSATFVHFDNSGTMRWTQDGSVKYFSGSHITIFLAGLLAVCFSLPYTFIVTFHQCLQRTDHRLCSRVHRLKPLLDAYGGPYKDKCRFWTGLLLFARLFLFVTFAVNVTQSPYINLLAILFVCLSVIFLGWILGGVYRKWKLDLLEASFLLNLAFLSACTLITYPSNDTKKQEILTCTSVGVAAFTISCVLLHKLYKKISPLWQRFMETFLKSHDQEPSSAADCSATNSDVEGNNLPSVVQLEQECKPLLA